jgi:hypothetical protein
MPLKEQLSRADADVAAEEAHIAAQERTIDQLRQSGHDTNQAERSLGIMQRARLAFVHHRKILLERLGLYRA